MKFFFRLLAIEGRYSLVKLFVNKQDHHAVAPHIRHDSD